MKFNIRELLYGRPQEYNDDLEVVKSFVEYYEGSDEMKYITYEIKVKDKDNSVKHLFKAIKFYKVVRLPKTLKQVRTLMDMQGDVIAGLWENNIKFITVVANLLHPTENPIGLMEMYGVQGVAETLEDAKKIADEDFYSLTSVIQGSYRTLEFKHLNYNESEILRERMAEMKHVINVRGLPLAHQSAGNAGTSGMGQKPNNPDIVETMEEFVAGMADQEYILMVLSSPVKQNVLEDMLYKVSEKQTKWQSLMQGSVSMNAGLSVPLAFAANLGSSSAYNSGVSDGHSMSQSTNYSQSVGYSESIAHSQGVSEGVSVSSSQSFGQNIGISHNEGQSLTQSLSHSQGLSYGFNHGESFGTSYNLGQSQNVGFGQSVGQSYSASSGESYGESAGTSYNQGSNSSQSHGYSSGGSGSISKGSSSGTSYSSGSGSSGGVNGSLFGFFGGGYNWNSSESNGINSGMSESASQGWNFGESTGSSVGQSSGFGYSIGQSHGTSSSTSMGLSQSTSTSQGMGISEGWGLSQGQSRGESFGSSVSDSISNSKGLSVGDGWSKGISASDSVSQGRTQSVSESISKSYGNTQGASTGVGTSTGRSVGTSSGYSGGMSEGYGSNIGMAFSLGVGKSFQFINVEIQNVVKLFDFQRERLFNAVSGRRGAFFCDIMIATPDTKAKSYARSSAKAAWYNPMAVVYPLQIMNLENEENEYMLYHFNAFSGSPIKESDKSKEFEEYRYSTILLSNELTAYTHPIRLSDGTIYADVENIPVLAVPSGKQGEIYMGKVISGERWTQTSGYITPFDFRFTSNELMHGFFAAGSRSGKTVAALRFIAEVANKVRRGPDKKKVRIICMDPKTDWRTLARFVEPERFRIYSLGDPNKFPIKLNPCKIAKGVDPEFHIDTLIDVFCRAYGLGVRSVSILTDIMTQLYSEAGVFETPDPELISERSKKVTLGKVFKRMNDLKESGKFGRDKSDAVDKVLDRLRRYGWENGVLYKLYCSEDGFSIDELLGKDDIIILESGKIAGNHMAFIFGFISASIYMYAKYLPSAFLSKDQFETVLVIEEANRVLTGDASGGDSNGGIQGQSVFEEMLDQAAGLGLFVMCITQKISMMPTSVIANCGLVFAGRMKIPDDITVVIRQVGREERYDDRPLVKWFPRCPTGWFMLQSSRTFDFKDSEPVLVKIDRLDAIPPTDDELSEMMRIREMEIERNRILEENVRLMQDIAQNRNPDNNTLN